MLFIQNETPSYERITFPSDYDYFAATKDGVVIAYDKFIGPYRMGLTFSEIHVFAEESELQDFLESNGSQFHPHWDEQEENNGE